MVKEEKRPYGIIYKATNFDGKNYIGKTKKTLDERWNKHINRADELKRARELNPHEKITGTHLNNAILKYGPESFNVGQIDVAYNRKELNAKEKYWIKEYDSMNPEKGYNMTEGGV
jgi:group I intron endonuclease